MEREDVIRDKFDSSLCVGESLLLFFYSPPLSHVKFGIGARTRNVRGSSGESPRTDEDPEARKQMRHEEEKDDDGAQVHDIRRDVPRDCRLHEIAYAPRPPKAGLGVGDIFFRPREIRDDQGQRQRQRQRQRNVFVSSFNLKCIAPISTRMFLLDVSVEYTRGHGRRRRNDAIDG